MPFDARQANAGLDALAKALDPASLRLRLAGFAREQLAELQSAGAVPIGPNAHQTFVNGRAGVAEEQVKLPGPITYVFNWLDPVVHFAVSYLRARSPKQSGLYRASFFVMVNGARIRPGTPIPPDAEVIVTNDQPYARKIDVGAMKMSVPPHLFNDASNAVKNEFKGVVKVTVKYIGLSNGYVLRRSTRRHSHTGHVGVRQDSFARGGEQINYPALVIRAA